MLSRCLTCLLLLAASTLAVRAQGSGGSASSCSNSDAFYFNVQPKSITVRQGGRAFLECSVSNKCMISFHWTLNNRPVLNTTRRYQNGSNLVITRVHREHDQGSFHCIATYTHTGISKESQPAQLSILWLSSNVSVVEQQPTGAADDTVRLECNANGSEPLDIRWFRNARPIKENAKNGFDGRLRIEQHRLWLSNASRQDNGVYSCMADNDYGSVYSQNNHVVALADGTSPNVSQVPSDTIAYVGGSAQFHCQFEPADVEVEWRRVDDAQHKYDDQGRVRQLANGSLQLERVEASDEGAYECLGRLHKTMHAYAARLLIATLAELTATSFEPIRHQYVVGLGKRFQLACIPPKGFPEPTVHWTRNGRTLTGSGRVRADGIKLVIDSATAEDAGEYVCVASNLAGKRQRPLQLHTSVPPAIYRHPMSADVQEGDTLTLTCEHEGSEYPITAVDWEKDGRPIQLPSSSQMTGSHSLGRRLQWNRANGTLSVLAARPDDSGLYNCVLSTADQEPVRSQTATVTVVEQLKFAPRPVDRVFEKGTNVRVNCVAKGPTEPTVRWMQVGRLNELGQIVEQFKPQDVDSSEHVRSKDGTLYFRNIRFSDAGLYMCVAVSQPTGVINATIKVQVMVYPRFSARPENATVAERDNVVFRCAADGFPKPNVYWYHERLPVEQWSFSNYGLHANGTLQLHNVSLANAGKFECVAGNAGGLKSAFGLLCVKIVSSNFTHCGQEVGIQSGPGTRLTHRTQAANADDAQTASGQNVSVTTVAIACSAAASYILLVVCLLSYCAYKRRRSRELLKAGTPAVAYTANPVGLNQASEPAAHTRLLTTPGSGLDAASTINGSLPAPHSSPARSAAPSAAAAAAGAGRHALDWTAATAIGWGSGVFGPVSVTRAFRVRPEEPVSLVLVKQLTNKDENVHQMLKEEMELYSKTEHANVCRLLLLCREAEPVLAVYEYSAYGNLKSFLLMSRHHRDNPDYPAPLNDQQLLSIAYQVSQGLEHISDQRFVHKDVAARNILVYPSMNVKIASLSLQNDAFLNEYYMYRNLVFPLRWMSAEALFDDDFSMKSDVWAFGVFVWELYAAGELPHQTLSNADIIEQLKADDLPVLAIPEALPEPAADLLLNCWQTDPRHRPTATQCRDVLGQLHIEAGF